MNAIQFSSCKVYGLFDPISKEIFYVGCTKSSLKLRLSGHVSAAKNNPSSSMVAGYISKMMKRWCGRPLIKLLKEVISEDRRQVFREERKWINKMSKQGEKLIQVTGKSKHDSDSKEYHKTLWKQWYEKQKIIAIERSKKVKSYKVRDIVYQQAKRRAIKEQRPIASFLELVVTAYAYGADFEALLKTEKPRAPSLKRTENSARHREYILSKEAKPKSSQQKK